MRHSKEMHDAIDYFEKKWPKGHKERGEAMVLMALSEIGGRENQKIIDGGQAE